MIVLNTHFSLSQDISLWPEWAFTQPQNIIHAYSGENVHNIMNTLKPGDKLIIHEGTYSYSGWYNLKIKGTADRPIFIEGAENEQIIITRPDANQNNFNVDESEYISFRNLIFRDGDTGVKLLNVNNLLFEDCEVYNTHGVAFAANSFDTHHLYFIHNHVHHTGGHGEGFYLGANNADHIMHDSLIYNNLIHDTTLHDVNANQQGDGIEIKHGSWGNLIKDNVIYNVNYPGVIVYGTLGKAKNIIEGNFILNSNDNGIQAQGEAIVRNNIVVNSKNHCIESKDHQGTALNLQVLNNVFVTSGSSCVQYANFGNRANMVLANNIIYNPGKTAIADMGQLSSGGIIQGNIALGTFPASISSGVILGGSINEDFISATNNNYYPKNTIFSGKSQISGYNVNLDFLKNSRESTIYTGAYEKLNSVGDPIELDFKYPARAFNQINLCDQTDILCVDDTPGDTQEYSEIQAAVNTAGPGDTVLIYAGNYRPNEHLVIQKTGTLQNPITIKGQSNGILIDGSDTSSRGVFFVDNSAYVNIENLEIKNGPSSGIRISRSNHITVKGVKTYNNQKWGIFTDFSDYVTLENNECSGSIEQHGIYFSNSGDHPVARSNILFDNNYCGLHMNGNINMGGDGTISDALIENNIMYNNDLGHGGSALNMDGVINSIVRNNLIYNQHSTGIAIFKQDGAVPSTGNQIYHNTVVIASDGRWPMTFGVDSMPNIVKNNIFLTQHASFGSIHAYNTVSGLVSDNNILTTNAHTVTPDDDNSFLTMQEWQAQGFDLHSKQATINDVFVNYPNSLKLKETSPAIDMGANVPVTTDIENNNRPKENGYDTGCYESDYSGSSQPPAQKCTDADTDSDGLISNLEMLAYISNWKAGQVTIANLMNSIIKWKNNCIIPVG